ncbi:hypothetical protein B0H13DRAFT_1875815 [Mycena leptocephala]|nr:hypothetical protein B0H13DRAFT_1875815 [Mycena leptocephala]
MYDVLRSIIPFPLGKLLTTALSPLAPRLKRMITLTRPMRVQKSKAGEGTAGRLKAESSVQPLTNEREKFENASPRRSQRLKPQGREEQEPLHIIQSYATKVPVGSGAPGPSRDSGTSHLQVSIKRKVSSARMTTAHVNPGRDSLEGPPTILRPVAQLEKPTSDTKAPQKAQNLPLTREGTSTDRTRNIAATSGSGSQRGVPRSLRTSKTPKMSQTLIQLGPHEISSSTRHDHEGFALPPSLPQCIQGLLRVDEINYTSVVIDPETIPIDMAKKRTSEATAGEEPTAMHFMSTWKDGKAPSSMVAVRPVTHSDYLRYKPFCTSFTVGQLVVRQILSSEYDHAVSTKSAQVFTNETRFSNLGLSEHYWGYGTCSALQQPETC